MGCSKYVIYDTSWEVGLLVEISYIYGNGFKTR